MKRLFKSLLAFVPFLFFVFPSVVLADTISNGVYTQTSLTVGDEWTGSGSYTSPNNSINLFVFDGFDDTKVMNGITLQGTLNGASVTVSFYNAVTTSSDQYVSSTYLGAVSVTQSEIGSKITVPYTNANAFNIQVNSTNGQSGQVRVSDVYGDPFDLTGTTSTVQGDVSTGHIVISQPSWWGNDVNTSSPVTTPITSVTTPTSTSGTQIINVYSVQTPPDWPSIEQGIATDIVNDIPPVPAPPGGSDQITTSPSLNVSQPTGDSNLYDPVLTGIPSVPPETGATSYNFSDSGDQTSIPVPTSDSRPFAIGDPMANLPFTSGIPLPGSAPDSSMVPSISGGINPIPNVSAPPVPTSSPVYVGSTDVLGQMPTPVYQSSGGGGPVPSIPSTAGVGTTPTPSPGGSASPPVYLGGSGYGGSVPVYEYPP